LKYVRAAIVVTVVCGLQVPATGHLSGQSRANGDVGSWNGPEVSELVERARSVRQSAVVDSAFRSYQTQARGYVYFYMDRPDSAQQMLIKADQVALDVWWRAPNDTKQRIVGLRDEKVLPTRVRYHLDHLSVVQDDFGDFIRMGDGDEVERVLHPLGPGSSTTYDFQLVDSVSLSYAAGQEEVGVYEVAVRPRDFSQPGFVGTVYLDRDRAAVVRMNFSFTPSSYVDPFIDYIRISLDNSLWLGEYWLPYRQEIEIRRESPVLDFLAGSIIRGRFTIGPYDFNVDLPDRLFVGRPVASVSIAERQAFPFERGLFDQLEEEGGLAPSPTMEDVRRQVRTVVEDEVMSGLAPLRWHAARISDFARYNRAEGVFLGAGATVRAGPFGTLRSNAGYSIGRRAPSASVRAIAEADALTTTIDAYWDGLGDIGGHVGATPLENTISAASGDKDYFDPFFRRGGTITLHPRAPARWSLSLRVEEQRSAEDVVSGEDSDFRPVLPVVEGTMTAASALVRFGLPGSGRATLEGTGGHIADLTFGSLDGTASWQVASPGRGWHSQISAWGGVTNPDAPAQALYLIGGRMTLPGHDYRAFAGQAYWLVRAEGTIPIRPPYLSLRGFAALGAAWLGDAELPAGWAARDSRGPRGSVGLGLSFGWDSVRLDVGRAVWGSGWEAVVSAAPDFRTWM